MVIVKDTSYLIKHRVEVGQFWGLPPADAYIELREPSTFDANKLQIAGKNSRASADNAEILALFRDLLPRVIVDHSLYKSEAEKMSADEVAALVTDKTELFGLVLDQYSEKVLFTLGKKSDSK